MLATCDEVKVDEDSARPPTQHRPFDIANLIPPNEPVKKEVPRTANLRTPFYNLMQPATPVPEPRFPFNGKKIVFDLWFIAILTRREIGT